MKKLSIITPLFKKDEEFTLTETSFKDQINIGSYEVNWIVVEKSENNGLETTSLDNGICVKHYKYPDQGEYDAINYGIKQAVDSYIIIICSGDTLVQNNVLERVLNSIVDEATVYSYGIEYEDRSKAKIMRRWLPRWKADSWRIGEMLPHPGLIVHKSIYDRIGGYSLSYSVVADYDFEIRLLVINKYKVITYNQIIINMSTGGRSYHGFLGSLSQQIELLKILKSNGLKIPLVYLLKPFIRWRQYFE